MRNGKAHDWQSAPKGCYPGEFHGSVVDLTPKDRRNIRYKATGEFRAPKKGEYYLSGATIAAYRAPNDFSEGMRYWIAVPGKITTVKTITWEPLETAPAGSWGITKYVVEERPNGEFHPVEVESRQRRK